MGGRQSTERSAARATGGEDARARWPAPWPAVGGAVRSKAAVLRERPGLPAAKGGARIALAPAAALLRTSRGRARGRGPACLRGFGGRTRAARRPAPRCASASVQLQALAPRRAGCGPQGAVR